MEYYSVMKKEVLPLATTGMQLEGLMLSERSKKKKINKDKYCVA